MRGGCYLDKDALWQEAPQTLGGGGRATGHVNAELW